MHTNSLIEDDILFKYLYITDQENKLQLFCNTLNRCVPLSLRARRVSQTGSATSDHMYVVLT